MIINRTAYTLAVLVLCPLLTAVLFFLPPRPLAAAFAVISASYIIAFRPVRHNGYLCAIRPAIVYFVMLYIPSVVVSHTYCPVPYPLMFCVSIASASLVCRAAYTLTSDLERRDALDSAECAIRKVVASVLHNKRRNLADCGGNDAGAQAGVSSNDAIQVCTVAPALAMMAAFIPLIRRAWCEIDEARRGRSVPCASPSMLASLISVCMNKALETQEALEARGE